VAGLFFEASPLASGALLTTLHPLLENVLQTVDHFEISCLGGPFSWLEKPRNRMGARSGLYGGCSKWGSTDPIFPSQTQNSIQTSPHEISGLFKPRKGSPEARNFEMINGLSTFFRSGWSVVRTASLAKGGTSKKRQSLHLHKVPTRSNRVSSRTLETVLQFPSFSAPTSPKRYPPFRLIV
jgi:hypothetical protein